MTSVQNGGELSSAQEYIKEKEDHKRPISNHPEFIFQSDKHTINHPFRTFLSPGTFHYVSGNHNTGKTHLMVDLMYLLNKEYDGCGQWEIVTNIFFYSKAEEGTKIRTPDGIHHIDYLEKLFEIMSELSGKGKRIALFLDDLDRFWTGKVCSQLKSIIMNRRKLKLLLFFSSRSDIDSLVNDYNNDSQLMSDYTWSRFRTQKEFDTFREDTGTNLEWDYIGANVLYATPEFTVANVYCPVSEWSDRSKKTGWFYDRNTDASVLRCGVFDYDDFWYGLENRSSLGVGKYIKSSLSKNKTSTTLTDQSKDADNLTLIAAKLKSMNLTDEAIEYALGLPKTTLRRHVEQAGFTWGLGAFDTPFRFTRERVKHQSQPVTETEKTETEDDQIEETNH